MPKKNPDLPSAKQRIIKKDDILQSLLDVDASPEAKSRVLHMETAFRTRVETHLEGLPAKRSLFSKFNTSPFVLLFHTQQRGYSRISEIEGDILPAKTFSSMETSAGRMIEQVALPHYGWETVSSEMHTAASVLDGRMTTEDTLHFATLKSGPRCLNDEMSENIAESIFEHFTEWAIEGERKRIEFTFAALYGTERSSNKKDWHILRKLCERLPSQAVLEEPKGKWNCSFKHKGVDVSVSVRIGSDWWQHLGDKNTVVELAAAMIRACVVPSAIDDPGHRYAISDLGEIVSIEELPNDYNVSLLQREQIPWLFFFMRHFCDELAN